MEQNAFQQAVIAAAQQLGLADYELYFQFADGISVISSAGMRSRNFPALRGRRELPVHCGRQDGLCLTQLLSEASAADIVRRAVDNAKTLEKDDPSFWVRAARAIPIARKIMRSCLRGTAHPESARGAGGAVCRPSQRGGRHGECRGGQPQHHPHLELKGLDLHYDRTVTSAVANPVVEENGEKDSDYDFCRGQSGSTGYGRPCPKGCG